MVKNIYARAFALPSIMIASVVMLIVLATAISSVATTRSALTDQYYNQIAKEAAESGLAMADACIKSGILTWPNPLRPNSDCSGSADQCSDEDCYLMVDNNIRTTFQVSAPINPGETSTAQSVGKVELTRKSNNAVWKTYDQDINRVAQGEGRKTSWNVITTSSSHTCAIATSGVPYCWGSGWAGQMGNGSTSSSNPEPIAATMTGALSGKSVRTVSAGGAHTCGIATDNLAYCWGSNGSGALGDGTTTSSPVPVAVSISSSLAGKTIRDIQTGYSHTCAIASDGLLYCWGENFFGQLGNNTTTSSSVPVAVTSTGALAGKTILSVSLGENHTCAVASDSRAYCWGSGWDGRLGNNTTTSSSVPVAVTSTGALAGKTIRAVSAGASYACVIASDNNGYCWGANPYGQLGNNTTTSSSVPVAVTSTGVLAGLSLKTITTGNNHTCAVASNSKAYCWGWNASYGQLGSTSSSDSSVPVAVAGALVSKNVQSIVAGYVHTCALADDHKVFCWGGDFNGQLGSGTTSATGSFPPSTIKALSDTSTGPRSSGMITVGSAFTCSIGSDNRTYCWGSNSNGYFGDGLPGYGSPSYVPARAGYGGPLATMTLKQISTGSSYTCAIAADDQVYCWGSEPLSGWTATPKLQTGTGILAGKIIKSVSVGRDGTNVCLIASDNLPYCWGRNDFWGGNGNNSTVAAGAPVAVVTTGVLAGKTVKQISSSLHSCVVASDDKLYCWGYNNVGQLGKGDMASSRVPIAVGTTGVLAGKSIKQVGVGAHHTCTLTAENLVYCWGANTYGQLGINSTTNSLSPVAVNTSGALAGKSIKSISVGDYHTCAIDSNDKAYCWGQGAQGRLGVGSNVSQLVPAPIAGELAGKSIKQMATGSYHACALTFEDEFYCWGSGSAGAIGNGTAIGSNIPVKVNPLPDYPDVEYRRIYY